MPTPISVSQLNALAKNLLEEHLCGLWVAGEVSNLIRAASGHYYFSLKDSHAQIRCALFKNTAAQLATALKEGDNIELTGKISIYEARGEFQITVSEIRLKGLGQLYEAYEKLKAKLQDEGVFAVERKKPLPAYPRTIGIVTSLAAAALRDVVSTLKRRAPEIAVLVYPTAVQGNGSELKIAQAIQTACARNESDVLIVCRGGGSIEDLWSFNEEAVVRAIEACTIPIVSGVGHETDFTLTDFVADVRAPTPTAAAELVSPNRLELLYKLSQAQQRLNQTLQQRYHDGSQKLDLLARHVRHPRQKLNEERTQLQTLAQSLRFTMHNRYRFSKQQLAQVQQLLTYNRPNIAAAARQIHHTQISLQQSCHALLQHTKQLLAQHIALFEAVSPQHILARGFAVVKNHHGQIIRSAATLKQNQKLNITFNDGEINAQVVEKITQPDLFSHS